MILYKITETDWTYPDPVAAIRALNPEAALSGSVPHAISLGPIQNVPESILLDEIPLR